MLSRNGRFKPFVKNSLNSADCIVAILAVNKDVDSCSKRSIEEVSENGEMRSKHQRM